METAIAGTDDGKLKVEAGYARLADAAMRIKVREELGQKEVVAPDADAPGAEERERKRQRPGGSTTGLTPRVDEGSLPPRVPPQDAAGPGAQPKPEIQQGVIATTEGTESSKMSTIVARNSDRLRDIRQKQLKRSAADDGDNATHYVKVDDDEPITEEVVMESPQEPPRTPGIGAGGGV